jgi:uncharacterized membrane protein HdeD (DUF308 family)
VDRETSVIALELNMRSHVAVLGRTWGALVVRGVLAARFGLPFLIRRTTRAVLIAIFAAYAFLDRLFALSAAARRQHGRLWWALFVGGLAGIAAARFALFTPGLAALTLVLVITGWALALGGLEIVSAVRLRKQIEGEWMIASLMRRMTRAVLIATFATYALARDGICSLVAATGRQHGRAWWALVIGGLAGIATAGAVLFVPGLAVVTVVFVIAGWAIAVGVVEVVAAVRLREETDRDYILCFESDEAIATPLPAPSERTELPVATEGTDTFARQRASIRVVADRTHGKVAHVELELRRPNVEVAVTGGDRHGGAIGGL